ncbi:rifin PIR protein, putative [Plasmodium sp. gorilla clade G2]|uniref:rifin PIR protein, putative n=1 Tax=Plasmodium sp. gorilla clade G2 TaxID=880535 RepID=UPI000D21A9CC|nr:rifin PIR protein, putative [Plasmodium sp. gorilla clade G2]SOV11138.1 rifin PIR protein, putative [Plasmodium sp. gorilla clade G2]
MNIYYISVLLFPIILNILVNNLWNINVTTTKPTTRLLCDCDIYTSIYDNDPEMQKLRENFERHTSQRFKEYEERMHDKRMKCKEQCDKEIQQIILKDKIEKELKDKLSVLETDIDIDSIPTCVCEKSVAYKTEKFCLNCGKNMGAIAPCWGLVCGVGYAGWLQYASATVLQESIKKGIEMGLTKITEIASNLWQIEASKIPTVDTLTKMIAGKITDDVSFSGIFQTLNSAIAGKLDTDKYAYFSFNIQSMATPAKLKSFKIETQLVAKAVSDAKDVALTNTGNVTSALTTTIIASVVVIVVIVLVMVIIYLILRYRSKKKMKKKLEYMKLLKE